MARKAAPAARRDAPSAPFRSEAVWRKMTASEHDELDRWNDVEEHLVRAQEHNEKHWKYDTR